MIPYDDLVIALATWRARQGLPVAQLSGALTPPPVTAPVRMTPLPGPSGPLGSPGSLGPAARTAPPTAPPSRAAPPPPAAEVIDDHLEVDPALIEDGHYESEGDDFAVAFGNLQGPAGDAAQPEQTMLEDTPGRAPKGRGRSDW